MKKVCIFLLCILMSFTSIYGKDRSKDNTAELNKYIRIYDEYNLFSWENEKYLINYPDIIFKNKTGKDIYFRYIKKENEDLPVYRVISDITKLPSKGGYLNANKDSCIEILNGKVKYQIKYSSYSNKIEIILTELINTDVNLITKSLNANSEFVAGEDNTYNLKENSFYINNFNELYDETLILNGVVFFNRNKKYLEVMNSYEDIILNKNIYIDYALENPLLMQQYIPTDNYCTLFFEIQNGQLHLKDVEGLRSEILTKAIVKHFDLLDKYSFFFDEYYAGVPKDINKFHILGIDINPSNLNDLNSLSEDSLFYIPYGKIYKKLGNNKYLYSIDIPEGYNSSQLKSILVELEYDSNNTILTDINERSIFCEYKGYYKTIKGEILLQFRVKYPIAKKDPVLNDIYNLSLYSLE